MVSSLRYRVLVGGFGLIYALASMLVSGMLYIPSAPLRAGWSLYVYPTGPGPAWTYPVILFGGPYFQVALPIVSGILMTLSAAGVGLGMSLAVLLGTRLMRDRNEGALGPTGVGSAMGLTPVMIALVTIGACCSTTAAATAGVSLAAQSSGTTPALALANAWYLGVFQVVVVYVALIAQEQLVRVYGFLHGSSSGEWSAPRDRAPASPAFGWRAVGSGALRLALVAAGLTWSLSMFVDWFTISPARASAATWLGWILQHQVPGILAVLVALFPAGTRAFWSRLSRGRSMLAIRVTLVISGLALLTWIPTPLIGAGAAALGNELLAFWQFPIGWGAVSPPALGIGELSFRWAFQFGLLGAFALAMGISPEEALKPLVRSSGTRPTMPTPTGASQPAPARPESG